MWLWHRGGAVVEWLAHLSAMQYSPGSTPDVGITMFHSACTTQSVDPVWTINCDWGLSSYKLRTSGSSGDDCTK